MCETAYGQSRSSFSPGCQATSGLFLIAVRADFKTIGVKAVLSRLPAAGAAVKRNDIVMAIKDRPSNRFTWEEARSLSKQIGNAYRRDINRGEEML